ncbi:hypothetical protein SAMN05216311_114175 [Chitinophaga sp. CF418]|nr:hypothetical protein SAMN05216311_114175 [Chitinophaga sp. CF418]
MLEKVAIKNGDEICLSCDVKSMKRIIQARKGDMVRVVAISVPALIVEDRFGYRFAINEKQIEVTK